MTTLEQWQAGKAVEGAPPWDGTGFPFPFNEDGSPALPGEELPAEIRVGPGATVNVPHDDPNVAAEPITAWGVGEFATFTDGTFGWDGSAWVVVVSEDTLSGWTVGELRQFAADHEPPIDIPAGSHKAAIIALILAALASDPDKEN